jgi:hypothetical protein
MQITNADYKGKSCRYATAGGEDSGEKICQHKALKSQKLAWLTRKLSISCLRNFG